MKSKIIVAIASIAIVAGIVYAAVPNGPQPSVGLYWYASVNPTAGAGVCAPLAQVLIRQDVPSIYAKTGAACTAWTLIGTSAGGGGGVTSVTCGANLVCTPNPIVATGTVALGAAVPTGTGTAGDYAIWATSATIGNGHILDDGSFGNTTHLNNSFVHIDGPTSIDSTLNVGSAAGGGSINVSDPIGTAINSGSWDVSANDTTAEAAGVGGNMQLKGSTTSSTGGGNLAAEIKASKTNSTIGDTQFNLIIATARAAAAGVAAAITIGADQSVTMMGAGSILGNGAVTGSLTADAGLRVFDAIGTACGAGNAVTGLTSSANQINVSCAAFGTGTVTSSTLVSTHVLTASGASAIQDAAGGATDDGTTFTIPDILATNVVDGSVSTPTAIATGTTNDYVPSTGTTSETYEISSSGIATLTGISVGQTKGRKLILHNVGGQAITLSNKTGSTSANQFALVGAVSWILTAGQLSSATFYYDGSFWQQNGTETLPGLTVTNNASIGGTTLLTGAVTLSNTSTFSGATSHIKSTSTSPGLSAGCGTGATITGGDISGTVVENVTSFSAPCTLTFASTFTTAPTCVVTPRGIQATFSYVPAATTLAVTNTSAETFDYVCIGH